MWRPDRRVSWSMVALLASLCGALLLGLVSWVPSLLGRDSGVQPTEPGLLTVEPRAAGVVTLGDGRAVQLDASGLTVTDGDEILLQGVRRGSPVTALLGRVEGKGSDRTEEVDAAVGNLEVTRLAITPGTARWTGQLVDGEHRLPTTLTVRHEGEWVRLDVEVAGADAVVVNTSEQPETLGRAPALPAKDLRRKAWWVAGDAPDDRPSLLTGHRTELRIGPRTAHRAIDLRQRGHTDIHVWAAAARLQVSSRPLPEGSA